MNINTSSLASSLGLSSTSTERTPKTELGQDDFLRLMTEQLKNQDPLKPLESTAFLGQLAQFSSVQSLQNLNSSFGTLSSSLDSNQLVQGANLVNRDVVIEASKFVSDGSGVYGEVSVSGAGTVMLEVRGENDSLLQKISMNVDGAGTVPFQWDGRLADGSPAGAGTFTVKATETVGGQSSALTTNLIARIESVATGSNGLEVNLAGMGSMPASSIRRIY